MPQHRCSKAQNVERCLAVNIIIITVIIGKAHCRYLGVASMLEITQPQLDNRDHLNAHIRTIKTDDIKPD